MRKPFLLALTPADTRYVEAVRADRPVPLREIVGHAVPGDGRPALCGADVTRAAPRTSFWDDFLDEQWGPIRLCLPCRSAASP
ncbi:hypothetical protein Ade02nite_60090 [Paractinoplanes deccanensis]|uniref:Uncharacterized protein n=1 Tax=Paractinoplanes deccanensis TaxID=113561 RepID=A0ABQ3YBK6_9ACTN|nr:hypothetical protein [Actinoplanes deccanensis]GID77368.1 hypothetical protein Ade02nite_60090 [Actinoplanes deccanensis]